MLAMDVLGRFPYIIKMAVFISMNNIKAISRKVPQKFLMGPPSTGRHITRVVALSPSQTGSIPSIMHETGSKSSTRIFYITIKGKHHSNTRVRALAAGSDSICIVSFLTWYSDRINNYQGDDLPAPIVCLSPLIYVLIMTSQSIEQRFIAKGIVKCAPEKWCLSR